MSPTGNQLLESALTLSDDERAELADRLWESLDGDTQDEIAEAWAAEIQRRMAMSARGEGHWISEDEVNRRLDAKYGPLLD
jgi:putative addiction module component (TIGR02574 family)